jgi:hypothetical protein
VVIPQADSSTDSASGRSRGASHDHSGRMTPRLSPVLSATDFPAAELGALRLDGEAFRLDDCVAPIDEIPSPRLRAAVLAAELPHRFIAEQHSAAWVWGAVGEPPAFHEVCADIAARARPGFGTRLRVREVVILHDDIAEIAGARITTPLRTAIDLARFVSVWDDTEIAIVGRLMTIGGFTALDCARAMNRRRNLPGKHAALERLALCHPAEIAPTPDSVSTPASPN